MNSIPQSKTHSADSNATNPPSPAYPVPPVDPNQRPGLLSFFLITAIGLGSIGLIFSVIAIPTALKNTQTENKQQEVFRNLIDGIIKANPSEEIVELQKEMNEKIIKNLERMKPLTLSVAFTNLFLSIGLLVFGIRALTKKEKALFALKIICLAHLPFEILRGYQLCKMGIANSTIMSEFMPKILVATQSANGQANLPSTFSDGFATVMMYFHIITYTGMAIMFIVFYVLMFLYLKGEKAKAYFGSAA